MDDPDATVPVPKPTPLGEGDGDSPERITESGVQGLFAAVPSAAPNGSRQWQPPSVEDLQKALPQYEITQFIACGGMGAVYKGTQRTLKRAVAIKVLPPEIEDGDMQYAERFKREAQAMARLSHPNIVAVHDAGEVEMGKTRRLGDAETGRQEEGSRETKLLYFVMEFIEGTDVHRLIATEQRLDPQRALAITAAVCDALAFAHEEGIIHRDIKPSNIMLDKKGRVKVADFGLAKTINLESTLLTGSNMAMGTADFMAPEVLIAGTLVDQRADLYAVGVMLYQMLTGRVPRGRFQLPSGIIPQIDPRLDAIVDKAMQTDRERRYSSALEMKADVEAVAAPVAIPSTVGALPGSVGLRSAHSSSLPSGEQVGSRLEDGAPWGRRALIAVPIAAVLAVIAFLVFKPPERDGTTRSGGIPAAIGTTASAVPPGYAWQRLFQEKEKDGWILLNEETLRAPAITTDAVRLELAVNSDYCALLLREKHEIGACQASVSSNGIALRLRPQSSVEKEVELAHYPLPPRNSSGTDRFEFRLFGTTLTVLWNGVVVGTTEHDAIKTGGIGIYGRNARVRNIEVLRPISTPARSGGTLAAVSPVEVTASSGGKSAATPAAPIKVRENTSPASSSPSTISNAPSTSFAPGQWVKVFTKFEDLPAELRKPDSGVKFENGWLRFGVQPVKPVFLPTELQRNYAVRCRFKRNADTGGSSGLILRNGLDDRGQLSFYSFDVSPAQEILLKRKDGDKYPAIFNRKATAVELANPEETIEFGVVGERLVCRIGASLVKLITDTHIKQGKGYIAAGGASAVRDIEVLNLDGLPEAEALRIIGVDEKGNDLRGKTPVPLSVQSTIVNPPSTSFPPGQWVRRFRQASEINDNWFKGGATWEDGWITPGEKNANHGITLGAPNASGKNWGGARSLSLEWSRHGRHAVATQRLVGGGQRDNL